MRRNKHGLVAFAAALSIIFFAGEASAVKKITGNAEAGAITSALCQGCHGGDGNSEDGSFPRLAGQYADYIAKQVFDFQKGHRANNDTMAGMAAMVASVQDAKDIGAYFAAQPMSDKPITDIDKKLAKEGESIYINGNPKSGVYGCVNCHGPRGHGKASDISVFPRIGGQHRFYIAKQLKDFRAGTRANDPAGMMADIAKKLTDDEIAAVSEYLAAQLP